MRRGRGRSAQPIIWSRPTVPLTRWWRALRNSWEAAMSKEAQTIKRLTAEVAAGKEFVNLAADRLQEPLASMKWQMDTLLADRAGSLKPKQRVMVEELYAVNQDAIRLVKDLLFVARLEGGRLKIDKQA